MNNYDSWVMHAEAIYSTICETEFRYLNRRYLIHFNDVQVQSAF
jgi:hypothetical protein